MVDGLFLIHPTASQASWTEWFYSKMNIYYLNGFGSVTSGNFSQQIQDYLMWHHFGQMNEDRNRDLIEMYRDYFSGKNHNARNLSMFLESYLKRTDLHLERGSKEKNFDCSVLILCGAYSPFVDETVNMNGRLNPDKSTWMKLSGCGNVLEEQPSKVAEAFRLFLQGIGYALTAYERRRSLRQLSVNSDESLEVDLTGQKVHIVENPIQC